MQGHRLLLKVILTLMFCDPAGVEHRALNGMAMFCDPAGVKSVPWVAFPLMTPAGSQNIDFAFRSFSTRRTAGRREY